MRAQRSSPSSATDPAPAGDDPVADDRDLRPSKSQKKRDMTALQKLGEELVGYPAERVAKVELPETLRSAIDEARGIRDHEGRRRQMQYIGRLMRDVDVAPIRTALDAWVGASRAETAALHGLERWRERLIDDDEALAMFATEHTAALAPDTLQRLRQAIRACRRERDAADGQRASKHYRELFRLVRDVVGDDAPAPEDGAP